MASTSVKKINIESVTKNACVCICVVDIKKMKQKKIKGISLAVQLLRLYGSTAGGKGLIPCQGDPTCHAAGQKLKKTHTHTYMYMWVDTIGFPYPLQFPKLCLIVERKVITV